MPSGFIGSQGLWVDLVRVPPSGTWERRRADRLAALHVPQPQRAVPARRDELRAVGAVGDAVDRLLVALQCEEREPRSRVPDADEAVREAGGQAAHVPAIL